MKRPSEKFIYLRGQITKRLWIDWPTRNYSKPVLISNSFLATKRSSKKILLSSPLPTKKHEGRKLTRSAYPQYQQRSARFPQHDPHLDEPKAPRETQWLPGLPQPVCDSRNQQAASRKYLLHAANTPKVIQSLGKLIYTNRWKIRKNMPSSLPFLACRD